MNAIMTDETAAVGVDFRHFNGATGEFLLPEITGSGVAVFDFDNDGDLDLYLVQGAELKPESAHEATDSDSQTRWRDRLYRNELVEKGRLAFVDVTESSGIIAEGYGMGVACGDYNSDGYVDIYVTNLGSNQLWRNNGNGTFRLATDEADCDDPSWSTSAAFVDYDADGWLDLYIANYVVFSTEMRRTCFAKSSARDYCGPDAYEPAYDRLFRNRGDGTFVDVTGVAGIKQAFGAGLGVLCADFNGDQKIDIYVANDGDPNQMWINVDGLRFRDGSLLAGTALNRMGQAEAGMGVDAGDVDNDGDEDLFMTHLEGESNTLYVNLGRGQFEDRTIEFGLHSPSLTRTGFGTRLFDYDNDGWLDVLVLNGAVRNIEQLARQGDPYPLHQPNQLFRNAGGDGFAEVTSLAGAAFQLSEVSRGAALGDFDNDGDTDVVINNNRGPARVLLNHRGQRQHWIGLRLLDAEGRRDALHARVEVVSGEKTQWRRAHSDGSYCSSSDPRLLVGLGAYQDPVTLRVHWPDGQVESWDGLDINQYWTLQQGTAPETSGESR